MAMFPAGFVGTREALHRLACFVIAPARKARVGRIGLRPTPNGFGTPVLPDGSYISVKGDELFVQPGRSTPITTLRDSAAFVGVELTSTPDIGRDLPRFDPDQPLTVDVASSIALGDWYRMGSSVVAAIDAEVTEAQIWPEHFDLAVIATVAGDRKVNVGFSPGDGFHELPYAYVGPFSLDSLNDAYWNAPFGAFVGTPSADEARSFIVEGLDRVGR
jgi:hypothetical protein